MCWVMANKVSLENTNVGSAMTHLLELMSPKISFKCVYQVLGFGGTICLGLIHSSQDCIGLFILAIASFYPSFLLLYELSQLIK